MAHDPRFLHFQQDRGAKSVPVHRQEKFLVAILGLWLVFLPWAFGTMHPWSQSTSLGLAALAFVVAALPRRFDDAGVVAHPARMLVRLPAFWLGLALFAFVALQSANPAWTWQRSETHWWLQKREALSWLPSGIEAPFAQMNGWRIIVIWAAPFLAGLAAWIGVTRRRSIQFLLSLLVINATAVALLGVAQKLGGTNQIYWHFEFNAQVFGSFVYRNHGAAFLAFATALSLGLAIWHYLRGEVHGARSTPAPVFVFLAVVLSGAIIYSGSRLGAVAVVGMLLAVGVVFGVGLLRERNARIALPLITAALALGVMTWAFGAIGGEKILRRIQDLQSGEANASLVIRVLGADLAREMLVDNPWSGVGAGGYRHIEAQYGLRTPTVGKQFHFREGNQTYTHYFRMGDAHNDHLQLLAELGVIGGSLVYGLLACAFAALLTGARRRHPAVYACALALAALLVFATLDFPFQNPAITGSMVVVIVLAVRWSDLAKLA